MSSKTILICLSIFRCGGETSVHGRPSWELAPYDCSLQNTEDFTAWCKLVSKECRFSDRTGKCGVVRFTTQFFYFGQGQSTLSLLEQGVKQRDLHDNERNKIKGGSRETKGKKCTGGRLHPDLATFNKLVGRKIELREQTRWSFNENWMAKKFFKIFKYRRKF